MDPEDARFGLAAGADAIVVSNHGGRQLDGAPSTISVLPEIVAAIDGRCEVLFDGGIRSGQDLAKALALGAGGMIGKSFLFALAAGGEAGVQRALEIFRDELRVTLALTGTSRCGRRAADAAYALAPTGQKALDLLPHAPSAEIMPGCCFARLPPTTTAPWPGRPGRCAHARGAARFKATGKRLILITGRELADLRAVFDHLHDFDAVVAENGAVMYLPATQEERPLAPPPPERFIASLRAKGVKPLSVGRSTWPPGRPRGHCARHDSRAVCRQPSSSSSCRRTTSWASATPRNDQAFLAACGPARARLTVITRVGFGTRSRTRRLAAEAQASEAKRSNPVASRAEIAAAIKRRYAFICLVGLTPRDPSSVLHRQPRA